MEITIVPAKNTGTLTMEVLVEDPEHHQEEAVDLFIGEEGEEGKEEDESPLRLFVRTLYADRRVLLLPHGGVESSSVPSWVGVLDQMHRLQTINRK